jgi:hypothetical protein
VDAQPLQLLLPGQVDDAEAGSDHAAMEAHAPIPQLHDLKRVLEIEARPVEEDISEPPAEDHAQRGVEDQVVGMAPSHGRARLADQPQQVPIAEEDAGKVGEAVPAQLEPAEVESDRIEAEAGEVDPCG